MTEKLEIYVLIRTSTKTGKIDKVITALGCGLLKMACLNLTTKTKTSYIFNRETGECVMIAVGKANDMPNIYGKNLGTCTDHGISLDTLHSIKDDRFDD